MDLRERPGTNGVPPFVAGRSVCAQKQRWPVSHGIRHAVPRGVCGFFPFLFSPSFTKRGLVRRPRGSNCRRRSCVVPVAIFIFQIFLSFFFCISDTHRSPRRSLVERGVSTIRCFEADIRRRARVAPWHSREDENLSRVGPARDTSPAFGGKQHRSNEKQPTEDLSILSLKLYIIIR